MNTNIETNMNSDISKAPKAFDSRRGRGLKAVVVVLSLAALCLAYRAANEAVALYGVLDKVQATLANEHNAMAHAKAYVQISETKPCIAGL